MQHWGLYSTVYADSGKVATGYSAYRPDGGSMIDHGTMPEKVLNFGEAFFLFPSLSYIDYYFNSCPGRRYVALDYCPSAVLFYFVHTYWSMVYTVSTVHRGGGQSFFQLLRRLSVCHGERSERFFFPTLYVKLR